MNKVVVLVVILLLAVAGVATFKANEYKVKLDQAQAALKKGSAEQAKKEAAALVKKVGTLIELPKEEPSVATVADKSKIKNQPFFAKAENGDKLLLFVKAKKVILYREKTNKIIEVGTLNVNQGGEAQGEVAGEEEQAAPTQAPARPTVEPTESASPTP